MSPKVFISYSRTSLGHGDLIRGHAERLRGDGVDVILDQWDLAEGQDKYAFMEQMVTDSSVSHVLVFSDKQYAEKADARKAGVGTESQIMSKEIYDKVDQKKFIPLVCERRPDGEPYLPTFFHPRIWIDFSSPERVNENWEQLIRALYGKPLHIKPALGKPPVYLSADDTQPSLPTIGKLATFREAILNNKPILPFARQDFLDAAFAHADSFRTRSAPTTDPDKFEDAVLVTFRTLLPLRDQFVDWITLEAAASTDPAAFEEIVTNFLERLLALRGRPAELEHWERDWFDAHVLFVYELFLYVVAALVRLGQFATIGSLLTTQYMLPESESYRNREFVSFAEFYGYSRALARRKERLKLRRMNLVADLIKERATRQDITFPDVMQAELIVFIATVLSDARWYPQTLIYAGYIARFRLFARAAQHKHFEKVRTMFGVATADELRERFKAGSEKLEVKQWDDFWISNVSFWEAANMDQLDTLH